MVAAFSAGRFSVPLPRRACRPAFLCFILFSSVAVSEGIAQVHQVGRWTPIGNDWQHEQIHMALLRGDGTYHSKLLSWGAQNPSVNGKLWGWNPGLTPGDNDCVAYPLTRFTSLPVDPGAPEVFCGGHSSLANGDLLITGGTDWPLAVGLRQSVLFRANAPTGQQPSQQWVPRGLMGMGRWYPTNVTMPNGNVLTFAGTRFEQMIVFGGTASPANPSGAATDDINRLGLNTQGQSLPAIPRAHDPANWPPAREGHSAVWHPGVEWMLCFGGRESGTTSYLRDVRRLNIFGDTTGDRYGWAYTTEAGFRILTEPVIRRFCEPPAARTR